ncbi:uncharacterized protein LOC127507702 isoform X4 [Ctenopharyngodon idella]|uniref:uncharacterized protein LOC127507702 isoform X4 n=1 Tax=Ctenopharyngodon idella TaxID=7959 RepID=UPI00223139B7|nr:uncharacterized protein LOC127507702 isoform X4 [Ctenopharyngodon idella]XP_051740961.1 uncharacterized protein LOC127507702 isoform X4 [Ctenopharyngodon idella]
MKSTKTKHKLLFTLILAIHIMSVQAEASRDDDVRILIVGIRGHSRFSAADILSGRKDGGQEDREIVKTPVITDEGRRMMLVTGPNLCEEDTARQSFTTALFLSSPGPHAVLMVLNLEDEASEQCDIVKRAQELLGAEVLQYCIVLLHQERFTGASRGIAGEMINACGGRFHMIRDSEPKPAQTAALVEEIDKLVRLNGDVFYSVLTQELETEETSQDVHEEIQLLSVIYDTLGGAAGIIGWIFLVSLITLVVYTEGRDKILIFGAKFTALALFMVYLRHLLSPDVAIPLNLALVSSLVTIITIDRRHRIIKDFNFSRSSSSPDRNIIGDFIVNIFIYLILFYAELMSLPFFLGSALVLGTLISVRSWSDVLIACYAAPGVTAGAYAFTFQHEKISRESPVLVLGSFLCCIIGATLSMGFVTVFALLDVTVMLLMFGFTMACWHLKSETLGNVISLTGPTLFFSCGCVLIGSVFLILGLIMSFLKVIIQNMVCSNLFYVALFLGSLIVIWRGNGNNTK